MKYTKILCAAAALLLLVSCFEALPTVDYKTCATVIERIEQLFYQEYPSGNITFHARFSPMGGK